MRRRMLCRPNSRSFGTTAPAVALCVCPLRRTRKRLSKFRECAKSSEIGGSMISAHCLQRLQRLQCLQCRQLLPISRSRLCGDRFIKNIRAHRRRPDAIPHSIRPSSRYNTNINTPYKTLSLRRPSYFSLSSFRFSSLDRELRSLTFNM
jgi:hypothetical protein